jgi:hypothetical protein
MKYTIFLSIIPVLKAEDVYSKNHYHQSPLLTAEQEQKDEEQEDQQQHLKKNFKNWHDCSDEEGITNPSLTFTNLYSDPAVVTKDSTQTIYKTISFNNNDNDNDANTSALALQHVLVDIRADFTQYYHSTLFNKWVPFLYAPNLDMCKEHPNLCPLTSGDTVQVVTIHPPLNRFTPYGLYRSKQVYKDPSSGDKIGCVDMQFLYCEVDADDQDADGDRCNHKKKNGDKNRNGYGSVMFLDSESDSDSDQSKYLRGRME